MRKYKILILSNQGGSGLSEDTLIKEYFEQEGHWVTLETVDFDETLDDAYDVIIRRNTWVSSEAETPNLEVQNKILIERLKNKDIKTVNLVGLDGAGKKYLCEIFEENDDVIPTINTLSKLHLLPVTNKYVIKDIKSFGNGFFQKTAEIKDLPTVYKEGDIIQPLMKFDAEIQCYFVGDKLIYAFEYTPSKYPNYPEPKLIELTEAQEQIAVKYAKYSKLKYGFQRIDFLRVGAGRLLLMEIEDHAAFMNLRRLPNSLKREVLTEYKNNIFSYIESR